MEKVKVIMSGWKYLFFPSNREIEKQAKRRAEICADCHNYGEHAKIAYCKSCSCPLAAKTRAPESKCPIGKW